ncbi:MAG: hypothetical protein Q4A78_02000 [Peptostreptococcaceae bacterium]|nr:hypothetical protein [Peptostreptococcaceae bacterium]
MAGPIGAILLGVFLIVIALRDSEVFFGSNNGNRKTLRWFLKVFGRKGTRIFCGILGWFFIWGTLRHFRDLLMK